jgi:hypothetical protein
MTAMVAVVVGSMAVFMCEYVGRWYKSFDSGLAATRSTLDLAHWVSREIDFDGAHRSSERFLLIGRGLALIEREMAQKCAQRFQCQGIYVSMRGT